MLTPIDIQNHVLKSTMGGYNKKETDDFIEAVQQSYEECYKENHDLKEKITTLSEGLQYYKQMETTLQKALVLAEKTSTETLEAAKAEAAAMEQEAQEKKDAMIAEAEEKSSSMLADAQERSSSMLNNAETQSAAMMDDAQQQSQNILTNAQAEAERLLAEAREKAEQMVIDANQELKTTTDSIRYLKENYNNYLEQYRRFVSAQLATLEDSSLLLDREQMDSMIQTQEQLIQDNEAAAYERSQITNDEFSVNGTDAYASAGMEESVQYDEASFDMDAENIQEETAAYGETSGYVTEDDAINSAAEEALAALNQETYSSSEEAVSVSSWESTPEPAYQTSQAESGDDFGPISSADFGQPQEETEENQEPSLLFGSSGSSYPGTAAYANSARSNVNSQNASETDDFSVGSETSENAGSTPFTFIDAE